MSSVSWYRDPCFERYWQTYSACQRWIERHNSVSSHIHSTFGIRRNISPPPSPPGIPQRERIHRKRKRTVMSPIPTDKGISEERACSSRHVRRDSWIPCEDVAVPVDEPEEMTEEMVAFFRQTVLHRLERDKEKMKLEIEKPSGTWLMPNDEEYVAADKLVWSKQGEISILPPTERPHQQRMRETKELYGEDAEKINRIEVLMRMKFDQEFNKSKPALWPNIPLRI